MEVVNTSEHNDGLGDSSGSPVVARLLSGEDPAMAIAPPNMHRSENTIRRSFVPPSEAIRAAALIEREEMLVEEIRFVGEASYRRRQEIELELSDIRRGLELLGFPRTLPPS
jgi:hypothetical protein